MAEDTLCAVNQHAKLTPCQRPKLTPLIYSFSPDFNIQTRVLNR